MTIAAQILSRPTARLSHGRIAFPRRNVRELPDYITAMAILLPRRGFATETSTSTGGGPAAPPPGFNAEQAKKPLPQEPKSTPAASKKAATEATKASKDVATEEDKRRELNNGSLTELASEKDAKEKKLEAKKEEQKSLTLIQKIQKEITHYWDGTKLLATEVRISMKLAMKMAAGYELSRRENRQVSSLHTYQNA